MLNRDDWLPLARKLDWRFSYTTEEEVFPEIISGHPWLPHSTWQDWGEAFKTSYREYVQNQHEKDMAVYAVRDAVGRLENEENLATPWINGLKIQQLLSGARPSGNRARSGQHARSSRFQATAAIRFKAI